MATFCSNPSLRASISAILSKHLFKGIGVNTILSWYDQFENMFNSRCSVPQMTNVNPSCLPSSLRGKTYLGHDLPVWIEGKDLFASSEQNVPCCVAKKRVMIIGHDPMRTAPSKVLTIATPWGLHAPNAYRKFHAKFYKHVMNPLLVKGCEVYVTDYYKLYATDSLKDAADSRNNIMQACIACDAILDEEIQAFNPTHIILMGSSPCLGIRLAPKLSIPIIPSKHIASRFQKGEMQVYFQQLVSSIQ